MRPAALTVLLAACFSLPGQTRYRCENGGACSQSGYVCDGTWCVPPGEAAGGGAAGGAPGGGGGGGGGVACTTDAGFARQCLPDAGVCWDETMLDVRDGGSVLAIFAPGDDDVWFSVSEPAGGGQPARGRLLHFDGCAFGSYETPMVTSSVPTLWGETGSRFEVVGHTGAAARIFEWSGGSFAAPSYFVSGEFPAQLHGALDAGAWAVGTDLNVQNPVVLRRPPGQAWSALPFPFQTPLVSVYAASASDVFIVGRRAEALPDGGVVNSGLYRWRDLDGGVFARAALGATNGQVVGDTNIVNGTRAGSAIYAGGMSSMILRWSGTNWIVAYSPHGPVPLDLRAIAGRDPNDVWAIGFPDGGPELYRYDGVNWTVLDHPPGALVLDAAPQSVWLGDDRGGVRRYR